MKKIFLAIAALIFGLTAMAAPSHVRVNLASGDNIVLSFDSKPEIAILADGIKVTSTETDAVTYEFDDVDYIDFADLSAIEKVNDNPIRIVNLPQSIEFSNVPDGSVVKLFSLDGKLLYTGQASGTAVIAKGDYPRGVYVVVVGASSFKVSF